METLQSYRHTIDKKVKTIFIDSFKKTLKKIDKKKFGFIGVIGSHSKEISHDIDLLIFPNKKQKIGYLKKSSTLERINLY